MQSKKEITYIVKVIMIAMSLILFAQRIIHGFQFSFTWHLSKVDDGRRRCQTKRKTNSLTQNKSCKWVVGMVCGELSICKNTRNKKARTHETNNCSFFCCCRIFLLLHFVNFSSFATFATLIEIFFLVNFLLLVNAEN